MTQKIPRISHPCYTFGTASLLEVPTWMKNALAKEKTAFHQASISAEMS